MPFGEAVERSFVDPTEFPAFWVEMGSMRSSESYNQLELPRRSNRFFGFRFDQYDHRQRNIGEIQLTIESQTYTRPLVWHHDNGMERLYLPTPRQTGIDYTNQLVLFQRSGGEFEATFSAEGSGRAVRWHNEAASAGTLFRAGSRSDRWCGLV